MQLFYKVKARSGPKNKWISKIENEVKNSKCWSTLIILLKNNNNKTTTATGTTTTTKNKKKKQKALVCWSSKLMYYSMSPSGRAF